MAMDVCFRTNNILTAALRSYQVLGQDPFALESQGYFNFIAATDTSCCAKTEQGLSTITRSENPRGLLCAHLSRAAPNPIDLGRQDYSTLVAKVAWPCGQERCDSLPRDIQHTGKYREAARHGSTQRQECKYTELSFAEYLRPWQNFTATLDGLGQKLRKLSYALLCASWRAHGHPVEVTWCPSLNHM
ncbi:uncharacterized protein BCR38DRAFT_86354 [Pseudomassariella vexata]|uniref:Uncharacterized protein n=1 Tax=Pseudomassariella vexata TaxID=1141098 RepID=A0A1Y2ED46_9PEZI|nr:uncharacterized protein BCR38DRAFT_86354 [Pseudomassariella vexata]ORY69482.1 hypothetical protein BCR38DRAFT_86354 [Pseudomassariella vexata]